MSTRVFDALGLAAILLWASTMACSRHLVEQVDPLMAAAAIYVTAGSLGCLIQFMRPREARRLRELPPPYWLIACGLFMIYTACLYLALGLSVDRQQAMEVSLINYLWPGLTLLLSVPILGTRARWWLIPGVAAAFFGAGLATTSSTTFSWQAAVTHLQAHPLPYGLALAAAVSWAAYSNLTRRLARGATANAVPLFMAATGLTLTLLHALLTNAGLLRPGHSLWSLPPAAKLELLYIVIFPTLLAYQFWDQAMRRGDATRVACFSYLTPLCSVLIYSAYLHIPIRPTLWLACALIIGGAIVCRYAIVERCNPER